MPGRTTFAMLFSLALTLTGGCSTTPSVSPRFPSNDMHFLWKEHVDVDREYLDRYACRDGSPLKCQCPPRYGTCNCGC